jgi:dTDP-4-amino-4,6-dideoxygalactose transaminase
VKTPTVQKGGVSVWAQYTIEVPGRDDMGPYLREHGVPTAVYYPIPIHKQGVYSVYPTAPGGLPVTEAKAGQVISLPMHPYLSEEDQDLVVSSIRAFVKRNA